MLVECIFKAARYRLTQRCGDRHQLRRSLVNLQAMAEELVAFPNSWVQCIKCQEASQSVLYQRHPYCSACATSFVAEQSFERDEAPVFGTAHRMGVTHA